jgi:hypothetical protein
MRNFTARFRALPVDRKVTVILYSLVFVYAMAMVTLGIAMLLSS